MEIIKAPENTKYLTEFVEDLPDNCIFWKTTGNCGGTTLALESNQSYIICVPYVSLIQDKTHEHKDVLGVFKQVRDNTIKKYVENIRIPCKKIMVTYDSLPRVLKYIDPSKFKFLVDEMHLLFTSYSFRYAAVQNVLTSYKLFKSYCFMTASMVETEFLLDEIKEVPITKIEWAITKTVKVEAIHCHKSVIPTVVETINAFLEGKIEGNAYFFVNSVDFIRDIVNHCNLTDLNTKAIWSEHNKKEVGIKRGRVTDPIKKINFLTSTCFEGVSLKDEDGKTYIISEGHKATTLLDIGTSIQQISYRLRNTKYFDTVYHIYSKTRYDIDMSYDEYKENQSVDIEQDKAIVEIFNKYSADRKNKMKGSILSSCSFISERNKSLVFDSNLVKLDLFNFKVSKHIYKISVNLTNEFEKHNFEVNHSKSKTKNFIKINKIDSFKECIDRFESENNDFKDWAYNQYPFLKEAIKLFTIKGIKDTNYDVQSIKRKINSTKPFTNLQRVKEELKLNPKITSGVWVSCSELKSILQNAYENLEWKTEATASHIEKIYNTREKMKKLKIKNEETGVTEWKNVRGYVIISTF